jgi:N-hydroxyarylamine O-acetyltransferase
VSLRARTLREQGPGAATDELTILEDADALATVLRETFGVDPDALGPQRLARLWEKAEAQHAAHIAS